MKDPKSHETRAQTPALAPEYRRRRGGNFRHCSTTWFCGTLQTTTHKPKLYFCSWVQNRAVDGLELIWIFSSITCYFLLFFLTTTKTKNQKSPDIWYRSRARFGLYFPFYLWDRNRTTQMGRGELLFNICASPQERKNKRTPNPKNLN